MKAGDVVTHPNNPELKKGRIISIQPHLGTVMVKWENVSPIGMLKYHIPHHLKMI